MTGYFLEALIYLSAAVVMVPLAKKLGLGSVLGYLLAGVIIGPVTGLVGQETATIQHFAEFGVVMMLFLVGLELEPRALWEMRNRLIGLGGLQISLTAGGVIALTYALGLDYRVCIALGLIAAMSSTAIVLQTFQEKALTKTEGGQNAFSVLLTQDIAVIPMLAVIPLLALPELAGISSEVASDQHASYSLVEGLPGWAKTLVTLGSIGLVIFAGHFLTRPLFTFIAQSELREMFVATTLFLVVGIAALMSLVGLSPALGTFLAGVLLANSEFKHELESNIEPFKGLLLGLFFITVGAGVNFATLADNTPLILGAALGIIALKAAVLVFIAWLFKIRRSAGWLFALSLSQVGEFGFVLANYSFQQNVLGVEAMGLVQMIIATSMFFTPLLFIFYERVVLPRYQLKSNEQEEDTITEKGSVIIAGAGRFGQIVNRMLVNSGVTTVALDRKASHVEDLRSVGIQSYFGDASKPDLLHTAGLDEAALVVIAFDDQLQAVELTRHLKHSHPKLPILARAYDRPHSYMLREAGADYIIMETFESALETATEALRRLGTHPFRAELKKQAYLRSSAKASDVLYHEWHELKDAPDLTLRLRNVFLQMEENMRAELKRERHEKHSLDERGWAHQPADFKLTDDDQSTH
ncbi:MAG: cation:proton antiporter [Pseudomonadales bacterium]|jgi:CPA2 family monovalent cation:H+ antiporter-2/glutathione-regulated potassium-efflux system ancillary protein KefC